MRTAVGVPRVPASHSLASECAAASAPSRTPIAAPVKLRAISAATRFRCFRCEIISFEVSARRANFKHEILSKYVCPLLCHAADSIL